MIVKSEYLSKNAIYVVKKINICFCLISFLNNLQY